MMDTDPSFDEQVLLLSEAARLDPVWGAAIWEATTDAQIDVLVSQARARVEAASDEAL